jgi:hypothetical protein
VETGVEGALHIVQYALDQGKAGLSRVVHEEAYLLNGLGEVGPSQLEVLQSASQTSVLRGVNNRVTDHRRQLGPSHPESPWGDTLPCQPAGADRRRIVAMTGASHRRST